MPTLNLLPFLSFPFNSILLFYSIVIRVVGSQELNSAKLVGSPRVRCGESTIRVTISTNEPFQGNVYSKGYFEKESCRVQGDSSGNMANITIPINADCGMRRRRIISPKKAIALEMTMILMMHPKFNTRNDQAFNIKCVYVEVSQKFTSRLDVSMLPSTESADGNSGLTIESEANLPKCKYEVLNDEKKSLLFATIGQPVLHRWSCAKATSEEESEANDGNSGYCLTVHSCMVDDGHGNDQQLLDINGCPVDKALMDEIEYESDLEAIRKSFVFKFADKPTIYFSCQLRLEAKTDFDGQCLRTICPPVAPSLKTSAENFARTSLSYDADFPRPRITVSPLETQNESGGIFANQNDGNLPDERPNDSFEASHFARLSNNQEKPQAHETTKKAEYNEDSGELNFDAEDPDHITTTEQIPYTSSPIKINSTLVFPRRQNISEEEEDLEKFATHLPRITTSTIEKQEDLPLPTISPLSHNVIQRTRLTTDSQLTESEEEELSEVNEERLSKLSSVEERQKAMEIDVNTPLSVLDLPSFNTDDFQPSKNTNQRNIIDMSMSSASKQVCVSRQALSALILVSAIIFLLISLLFGAALWRFVRRPRVLMMSRTDPFNEMRSERRVLSAFHN